jgi:3'(2'), 5'-bisphosphate nucleotidase
VTIDRETRILLDIAREASRRVMEIYATEFTVELKGPEDPVTRADREANEIICSALAREFPDASVVAEETAPDAHELARLLERERVFFVDPVDGTREFADKNGEFAVMIGLAVKGRAALGVVTVPAAGYVMFGRVGAGAFLSRTLDVSDTTPLEPLRVTALADSKSARAVVSRSHRSAKLVPILERLGVTSEVPIGSVGLKVARVVQAIADLYVHPSKGAKKWDACGPSAILEAAGGRFTDCTGAPIDFAAPELELSNGIVATNGALHDAVIAAARGIHP